MKWDLIAILGNVKTTNDQAIELLIKALSSGSHSVPDKAITALSKLGEKATEKIKKLFPSQETFVKLRMIKVLSAHKDHDSSVFTFLKSIKTDNAWVKDALEDALALE